MKSALITGGLGLIGSNIAKILLEENRVDKVVLLDHFGRYTSSLRLGFIDYRKLRLKDIENQVIIERGEAKYYSIISKLLRQYKPDYVFHLAALPLAKIDNLNVEETKEGAVDSTAHFVEVMAQLKNEGHYEPQKFVYASSSMVYGDFIAEEALEEHPTKPKELYGTMKLAGEIILKGLGDFYQVPYSIVRPSAVYGPTDMNRRVSQIFIEKAIRNEVINVQGKDEKLDFTYVKDIARGFVLAAISPHSNGQIFNITSGNARTLLDFVNCLKVHFPKLRYKVEDRDEFRPKRGTLNIDKAKSLLNYAPTYTLEKGITEYVEFLREIHKI
jgi:nucleoside-diphosphate-sugar epimerase